MLVRFCALERYDIEWRLKLLRIAGFIIAVRVVVNLSLDSFRNL